MNPSDVQCFQIGSELDLEIFVFAKTGTYSGNVENLGAAINNGLGHEALDGDFCVNDNDGTMISYRLPDLSGTPGTLLLGDGSFKLENGMCFVLTADYEAEQLPFTTKAEALAYLLDR